MRLRKDARNLLLTCYDSKANELPASIRLHTTRRLSVVRLHSTLGVSTPHRACEHGNALRAIGDCEPCTGRRVSAFHPTSHTFRVRSPPWTSPCRWAVLRTHTRCTMQASVSIWGVVQFRPVRIGVIGVAWAEQWMC
jgi:hypothetical protein